MSSLKHLVAPGIEQALATIQHHNDCDRITRLAFPGALVFPKGPVFVAVHRIEHAEPNPRRYCEPHRHNCDELNIFLSDEQLVYRVQVGDEVFTVEAPACVRVPAGAAHSANLISGSGHFIVVLNTNSWEDSLLPSED